MFKEARNVRIGDLVDLQGDKYADPKGENPIFPYELVEVVHVEHETEDCTALGFEGFDIVGFPPSHKLNVRGHKLTGLNHA